MFVRNDCKVPVRLSCRFLKRMSYFLSDVPFLPLQMPQGIQEEEKSSQSKVDEGIQKVAWQRATSGMACYGKHDTRCMLVG